MATPNFCSWQAIKEQVAANLHVQPAANLSQEWDNICSHAARRAATMLRSILTLKGYTPDQIAAWDDIFTYSQQLGVYFAHTAGAALATFDVKQIEWMNCEKEMRQAQVIIISGEAVAPPANAGDLSPVLSGQIEAAQDGLRGMRDPFRGEGWRC